MLFIIAMLGLSMFAGGAGAVNETILVATNRYVILDDPITGTAGPGGFANPFYSYSGWTYFTGMNTKINATALFIDDSGLPLNGRIITFNLYQPNGTELVAARINATTNAKGLANFSFDMNARNYYGNWTVKAANSSLNDSTSFIYNWWGCAYNSGTCSRNHNSNPPSTGGTINSPYASGRDATVNARSTHYGATVNCTWCHQSYDGTSGDTNPATGDAKHLNVGSDVHRTIKCDNVNCHNTLTTHQTNAIIGSCYSAACHTPANRSDISSKSTLSGVLSIYSSNNGSAFNSTFHTPNSTVPCFTCHGPMHNITKPDESNRFIKNTNTESTQCTTCHKTYNKHNASNITSGGINCTLCHSDDVHYIQVFSQSGGYVNKSSALKGNCTNCHQNSSFYGVLKAQPKAGNQSGRNPPNVTFPMEHSDAANAGMKWNQTPGYWTNSNQLTWCMYCHGNTTHNATALGRPSSFDGNNVVGVTFSATTSWCASCHWQGYSSGANNYNSMVNTFKGANLLVPPEITGNATYSNTSNPSYFDHTSVSKGDQTCDGCHGTLTASTNITGLLHNVAIGQSGGANCTNCHNVGGSAGSGKLVNFTAMNDTNALHKNLNSLASTSLPAQNKKCWACHGNGSEPSASSHPTNYQSPSKCVDCHVNRTNLNYTPNSTLLNVTQHYWNGTSIDTAAANTCYDCHNKSEMMLGAFDPDGAGGVYSGANGGNGSSSHYGKKRADYSSIQGTNNYCYNCHNNGSTVFPFIDTANKTIANHSVNNPATNPACSTCHSTGRIHNSTLNKPAFALPNSTYCTTCHGAGGSASLNNKSQHNGTVACTQCHLNSSRSIHPVRYLEPAGTWNTVKTSAVNCTNCHQNTGVSGFNAPIIPSTLKHSNNISNGSLWNATAYWTTEDGSCYYCHNNTKHNTTALGRINNLIIGDSNNTRNGSLDTTTYCIDCHYNSNSKYMGSQWNPVPPLITVNNTNNAGWQDHSGYLTSGIKDSNCKSCHALNGTYSATSLNYSHSLDIGVAGGPNCMTCHNLATGLDGAPVGINFTAANQSVHFGMNSLNATNKGYAAVIGSCWACHDSDGNVTSGHPDRYKNPKICTDCHIGTGTFNASAYNALVVSEHIYNGADISVAGNSTSNIGSCINCHENVSEMIVYNNDNDLGTFTGDGIRLTGGNNSFYHYGKPRPDLRVGSGGREANCLYCHQNLTTAFANSMIKPEVSKYVYNHTDNPTQRCVNCHGSNSWIHNSTLTIPNGGVLDNSYCLTCHGSGIGGARPLPETHNTIGVNCWNCHQDPNTTNNPMYQAPIHGMMYAQTNGSYSRFVKGTPANCTTCHVYNLVNTSPNIATRVPALNHSTDTYAGKKWGNYWDNTSMVTGCNYCHQPELHNVNSALLGNVSTVQGGNTLNNADLANSTWCANCHYKNAPGYKGDLLALPPPEITNSSLVASDGTGFFNHSGFANYNDSECKACHGSALGAYAETTLNLSHSVSEGGGGPDCVSSGCHGAVGSAGSPYMNWTSLKTGMHAGLNSNAVNTTTLTDKIDKACWACHGDGTQPSGHPANYKTPSTCVDCHLATGIDAGKYNQKNVTEHQHVNAPDIQTNSTYARCENCHNNSLKSYTDNERSPSTVLINYTVGNVSHYGANKTAGKLMEPSVNSTNCVYCHLNNSNRAKWANATNASATVPGIHGNYNATTPSSECWSCHIDGGASNVTASTTLHSAGLNAGASEFCLNCHGTGGSATKVNNITITDLGMHADLNTTGGASVLNNGDCQVCHFAYPNGTGGSHSMNVSSQNTYYCEDCHGPVTNSTVVAAGKNAATKVLIDFFHGAKDPRVPQAFKSCTICHAANDSRYDSNANRLKIYHNQTPLGKVGNPGWAGWTIGQAPGCDDCHQSRNSRIEPFRAPGKDHYVSGGCSSCHGVLRWKTYTTDNVHRQIIKGLPTTNSGLPNAQYTPPTVDGITISGTVVGGASTTIRARGLDNYLQIEAAQYRVVNSSGEVIGWTDMTADDGFNTRSEMVSESFTAPSTPGQYSVYVRVMASGARKDLSIRMYPYNGMWSDDNGKSYFKGVTVT